MSLVSEVQVEEEPELEEEKKGFWGKVLDVTQTGLDVAGMIPVIGEVADLANAGIYAARGDYTNAALSAAAAIPFVGWAATGAKFAVKGSKLLSKAGKVIDNVMGVANKVMDKAGQVAKAMGDLAKKAGDTISGALGKVMTKVKGLASNFSPVDLANKLKGKLNDLLMKSPKLANALNKATDFTHGLMADVMSDAMFTAAMDMLSNYADSNILLSAMMIVGSSGGGKKKGGSASGSNDKVKSNDKEHEVYGPYYDEAKKLHESNPDWYPNPDESSIVKGKELKQARADYEALVRRGELKKGHHKQGLSFGGKNVDENIKITGESTIRREKIEDLDLDFYHEKGYGKKDAKVLKIYEDEKGIIHFGNNPKHTEVTVFQNKVLKWQRDTGKRKTKKSKK
ncbi:hypothetical protein [Paenibacillus taichungensis]|uniref:hypothetical protein n=1 Tax=Paenibacillus taichungensis TaxID=484184 RepID=UPI0035D9FEB5